jgi:hypothetical protein
MLSFVARLGVRTRRVVALSAVLALFAAGLAFFGIWVTTTTSASASTGSPLATESSSVPCGSMGKRLPDDLQADLTALADLPVEERVPAAKEIRDSALAGDYGARVQNWAERRDERRERMAGHVPSELTEDLQAAQDLPEAEQADAYQQIWQDALSGEYGDKVAVAADRIQERRDTCGGA